MGKIFTWEQIEHGKVPTRESFIVVAKEIKNLFGRCAGVEAGLILGSVVRDRQNRRSDLDCLLVINPDQLDDVNNAVVKAHDLARAHHVPFEPIFCFGKLAKAGVHSIDPLFVIHLKLAVKYGGVIKHNPLPFITVTASPRKDAQAYIGRKIDKIMGWRANFQHESPEEQTRILRKVMEAPTHVARKVVAVNQGSIKDDDSKSAIFPLYMNCGGEGNRREFESLLSIDEYYSRELEVQLGHEQSKLRYRSVLHNLENTMPAVLSFLEFNARLLTAV